MNNQAQEILTERVLLYLRYQHKHFGTRTTPPNPTSMSPSMIAYLKHDLNDLMIEGKVDKAIFGNNFINCDYICNKLPTVLDYLVSTGSMEKTPAGYVLKPWTSM